MNKKIVKLVVAASMLAGSLGVGIAPRAASAALGCQPICCDAGCTSIRQCSGIPGRCICKAYCEPAINN
jgi:hypothetical protein